MIVVDASVILHLLIDPVKDPQVTAALEAAEQQVAPSFLDLEILNGLRKQLVRGLISEERAAEAVADLAAVPVERRSVSALTANIWSYRHNVTAYDAAYVTLAEALDCPLLTRDMRLKSAVAAHTLVQLV